MKTPVLQIAIIFLCGLFAGNFSLFAQNVYGDLELQILIDETIPAQGAIAMAIDPDLQDTTTQIAGADGIAYFDDLYVYTINGINSLTGKHATSLNGKVKIYDLYGSLVDEVIAENGTVLWNGTGSATKGIYLARDGNNNVIKFFYANQPTCLGTPSGQYKNLTQILDTDTSNTYQILIDGRFLEFYPFDLASENLELFEGDNQHTMQANHTPDAPAMGQIEILVDEEPCIDSSEVKMVRPGNTDTTYLYTQNGSAFFDETANITSHPFGNFSREYLALISGENFLSETNSIQVNLAANYFLFNPNPIPSANGVAIFWNGTTPTSNVEVNIWKLLNPTDTTTHITNAAGKIWYDGLSIIGASTQYVFQSHKNDGVNPVLTSIDTASLVSGSNPILNFYLEEIPQFYRVEGTIRHFYDQTQIPESAGMMLRDKATQVVIDSTGIDANGLYSLANIPAGFIGEMVLVSPDTSTWFHRIHDYDLPEILQSYDDSLISNQNTCLVPREFIIPQTKNDPAPESLAAVDFEVAEWVGGARINGEEAAWFKNNIYLTNFGIQTISHFITHYFKQLIASIMEVKEALLLLFQHQET